MGTTPSHSIRTITPTGRAARFRAFAAAWWYGSLPKANRVLSPHRAQAATWRYTSRLPARPSATPVTPPLDAIGSRTAGPTHVQPNAARKSPEAARVPLTGAARPCRPAAHIPQPIDPQSIEKRTEDAA